MSVKETCLVTGCAGFVGSHLSQALLDKGFGVVGVDNFATGKIANMAGFADHEHFHFYEESIGELGLVSRLHRSHPTLCRVFHLAAIVSVPYSIQYPQETMHINFASSVALYQEAMDMGFKSFVFAGSAAEYGNLDQLPLKEEAVSIKEGDSGLAKLQASPYGQSKYLVSRFIETCGYGCSLRFFNIFGPRQDAKSPYSGVISKFVDQALHSIPLTVEGDGRQSRDFLYVSDAVKAYLLAAGITPDSAPPLSGIYNVGRQESTTVLQLAEFISRVSGQEPGMCHLPPRDGDIRHSLANVEKMHRATGFSPEVELEDGLQRVFKWAEGEKQDGVQGAVACG